MLCCDKRADDVDARREVTAGLAALTDDHAAEDDQRESGAGRRARFGIAPPI